MLIIDDYSGTSFYSETDPKQEPILSRAEIKRLRKAEQEYWFFYHLMQWGTFWNSAFDPPKEEKLLSMHEVNEWLATHKREEQ